MTFPVLARRARGDLAQETTRFHHPAGASHLLLGEYAAPRPVCLHGFREPLIMARSPRSSPSRSARASQSRSPRVARSKGATPPVLHPDAAGIDIGATHLYVALPPGRDPQPVQVFETFTEDLARLVAWLKAHGITSVAMESTGVLWIPVFQFLETYGFEVCLVNARHAKNVPGRKTDVSDCQWLQYLHSVGLLAASFRPPDEICAVRTVMRHRSMLVAQGAEHIQHMQKSLTQMNLHLQHVLRDLSGKTGLAIVDAILQGERDPARLATLRDPRVHASEETVCKALVGDYRPEHVFTLRQARAAYSYCQLQLQECDVEIERLLAQLRTRINPDQLPPAPPAGAGSAPARTVSSCLHGICGPSASAFSAWTSRPCPASRPIASVS